MILSRSLLTQAGTSIRWRYLVLGFVLTLICWPYIYCLSAVGYNYLYWIIFSSTVRIAAPYTIPAMPAGGNASMLPVPKILHQTWLNETIPAKWKEASESCRQLHAGYEYRLWTDEMAERLIETKFPWFLDTYRGYPHDIQRVDALRYFVLYEYRGIYLDLDIRWVWDPSYIRGARISAHISQLRVGD